MDLLQTLLNEKLEGLLHQKAEIAEKKPETRLTYHNPYGGKPVQVRFYAADDIKVTLNKTPRFYPQDQTSIARLLRDVENFATGKTVSLDFTDHNGNESKLDRITKIADVEALTVSSLIELTIRINLLESAEAKDLLASGGTVNVHFWNTANDFRFRQIGDKLEKI